LQSRSVKARSNLGAAVRHHPEQVEQRRRELAEAKIADHVERVLATAPPLSDEQAQRIAALLLAGGAA
jgi:hypothetical protein